MKDFTMLGKLYYPNYKSFMNNSSSMDTQLAIKEKLEQAHTIAIF
jgi:hypothetical protein